MKRPNSIPVESIWNEKIDCWQIGEKNKKGEKIGQWLLWNKDGTRFLELFFNNNELKQLIAFNKKGEKNLIEEYVKGQSDLKNTLNIKYSTIVIEDKKYYIEYNEDKCSSITHYKNGNLIKKHDISSLKIFDIESFKKKFEELYGALLKTFEVIIECGGFFEINQSLMNSFNEFFEVTVLFDNGRGDEILVIQEDGFFLGKVYANYHEEGLFSVECIDDFVEDEEVLKEFAEEFGVNYDSIEDIINNKDKLIQSMPFQEYKVADNLDSLFKSITVCSRANYFSTLKKLD